MSLPRKQHQLLEINTRLYLSTRETKMGRPATLDDIPDHVLDGWARAGFDLIWMLGVWQTGPGGRKVSASIPGLLAEYRRALPDFRLSDVCGSPFAITEYVVHRDFGGDDALDRFRQRLRERGLQLILDFVPNHTGRDHRWVTEHIDYYVEADRDRLEVESQNYVCMQTEAGAVILAHGRDPNLSGWTDTLQLNYGNPDLQHAMTAELLNIADRCDGVRCDMAMLVLPEVFRKTWGISAEPFWPAATRAVLDVIPGFVLIAEAYWGLESRLLEQGFDYIYDKRLYDRLRERSTEAVRAHLRASPAFQARLVRFLENHDEGRAATIFPPKVHRAAAIVAFLIPGMRFLHEGQFEGRKIRVPVQLGRGPSEPIDHGLMDFYDTLMRCLRDPATRDGVWQLLECRPAWEGNWTSNCFLAYSWADGHAAGRLVVVNYADHQSQCFVSLPWTDLPGRMWRLRDRMGPATYVRDGDDLTRRGLYVDMPGWAYHVFDLQQDGM